MLDMFQMGRRYRYQFNYIHKRIMRELRYRIRSLLRSKTRRNRQDVTLEVLSGVKEVENN